MTISYESSGEPLYSSRLRHLNANVVFVVLAEPRVVRVPRVFSAVSAAPLDHNPKNELASHCIVRVKPAQNAPINTENGGKKKKHDTNIRNAKPRTNEVLFETTWKALKRNGLLL